MLASMELYDRHNKTAFTWFEQWAVGKGIAKDDRVYHELSTLFEAIEYGGIYDQLNLPALFSFEVINRRIQSLLEAYRINPSRPNYEMAEHYSAIADPFDGVVSALRERGVKMLKEKNDAERVRQVARDLKTGGGKGGYGGGGPEKVPLKGDDEGKKGAAKKGRGRGGGHGDKG
jgi:hypothetical protein